MSAAPPLAPDHISHVVDFHRLAFGVLGEARYAATKRFGLRAAERGFTTPAFTAPSGAERQLAVAGAELVVTDDGVARAEPITTLAAAATFVGLDAPATTAREHDSPELGDVDAPLNVTAATGELLGWWFTLGGSLLGELAANAEAHDPDEVQLWPGHFDIATAVGFPDADNRIGRTTRATYGLSPGDHNHDTPYAYVAPWAPDDLGDPDDLWNATGFIGASMSYAEVAAADGCAALAEFFATCFARLHAPLR